MYKKQSKNAYSFAEVLITLVIIAMVALLTMSVLPKKQPKEKEKNTHGTYACAIFDNEDYVYASETKDDIIPIEKDKWKKGKCGEYFKMPTTVGILDVKVVGGGGAGGDAKAQWDTNFIPLIFEKNSTFRIDGTGFYEITVYGDIATSSSLSDWSVSSGKCFAPIAARGESILYKGYITLYSGDILSVNFEEGSKAIINTQCGVGPKPLSFPGTNGNDIVIKRNDAVIVKVVGSEAGTYTCRPSETCSRRFEAQKGSNGYLSNTSATTITNTSNASNYGIYNKVIIKWSSQNSSTRLFKKIPGCGGLSGEINSTLYPILRKSLPKISIGKSGTPTEEPTETTFGALIANPGKNNKSCITTTNKNNGAKGVSFTNLKDFISEGGAAGVSAKSQVDGGDAQGFGAGGGGGAYYSSSEPVYNTLYDEESNNASVLNDVTRWYEGKGGKGGSGLLIISW